MWRNTKRRGQVGVTSPDRRMRAYGEISAACVTKDLPATAQLDKNGPFRALQKFRTSPKMLLRQYWAYGIFICDTARLTVVSGEDHENVTSRPLPSTLAGASVVFQMTLVLVYEGVWGC